MAITAGTKFITYSPDLDLKEKRSAGPNSKTRVYTIEEIVGSAKPYISYVAYVTQVAGAPVSVVMENTLSGTPVWSWTAAGDFLLTLAGEFTVGKTVVFSNQENQARVVTSYVNDVNSIGLFSSATLNGVTIDSNVSCSFEVRVYN